MMIREKAPQDLYPGLNDISDALEALPVEVIRHFTLLREIDAKCVVHVPTLNELINKFFSYPDKLDDRQKVEREEVMAEIRRLIRELMPCQEEKMHVAGVAAETIKRHLARIDHDYGLITETEIPEEVQFGAPDHPAIVQPKNNDTKAGQSSRSESRREAIAAKKAQKDEKEEKKAPTTSRGRGAKGGNRTGTPVQQGAHNASHTNNPPIQFHQYHQPPQQQQQQQPPQQYYSNNQQSAKKRKINEVEDAYGGHDDGEYNSRPSTPTSTRRGRKTANNSQNHNNSNNNSNDDEPVYCYCHQVSYGEMVGCDGPDCKNEWFHLPCIGLSSPPKGQWFCEDCASKYRRRR